jgi:hypothetical protein
MLRVSEAKTPLLKSDRHYPAFVLTCDIEYLKYVSMCKRVSRFDFGKADVGRIILQLSAVDWSDLLRATVSGNYIVRIEGGLKNNQRGFLQYADMKRNASGYRSSKFFGNDCARDTQSIANLFTGIFQSVYVPDSDWPTPGDGHKMSAIECTFLGLDVNKGQTELHQLFCDGWLRLSVPLKFVFNLSLSAGVFPAIWKELFVSILSDIPNLFEKMVCNRITPVVCPVITCNMVL